MSRKVLFVAIATSPLPDLPPGVRTVRVMEDIDDPAIDHEDLMDQVASWLELGFPEETLDDLDD